MRRRRYGKETPLARRDDDKSTKHRGEEPEPGAVEMPKPEPPAERWRLKIQDEIAAECLYDACVRYDSGDRSDFVVTMLGEFSFAWKMFQLEGERLRLDYSRFNFVARVAARFIRDEDVARQRIADERDRVARETTTRRIVRAVPVTNAERQRRPIIENGVIVGETVAAPAPKAGALVRRGALYGK